MLTIKTPELFVVPIEIRSPLGVRISNEAPANGVPVSLTFSIVNTDRRGKTKVVRGAVFASTSTLLPDSPIIKPCGALVGST